MAGIGKRVLSVSINNEYIKICELTKAAKSITVHKIVTIETPERCYNDGLIRDKAGLVRAIRKALDDNEIETTRVIFSVASTKIATKEVVIPNVKENRIESIVNTNAMEYFPVQIDDYIIRYTILERLSGEEGEQLKLLVMAAPEAMIGGLYELAEELKLSVTAIDYGGNSTYQALRAQIDETPCIVVWIENDSTVVNVFVNGTLQLQRTVPYGKSALVNAVMSALETDYEGALHQLQKETLLHTTFDGDMITESMRYLIINVNRVIDYYVSRNVDKPIEKAYIVGNATTILGLRELFASEIKLPLECIDILKNVSTDKKTQVNEIELPSYLTVIGATYAPVRFVPKNIAEREQKQGSTRIYKVVLAAAAAGSVLLVAGSFGFMMMAKQQRDTAKAAVDRIQDIQAVVDDYYEAKDIAADAENFRNLSKSNNDGLSFFILELEAFMPSDVSIKSMNVNHGAVTISGVASSKASVGLLVQNLRNLSNVQDVKLSSESEELDENGRLAATFSMTCSFTDTADDLTQQTQNLTR